ncbi:C69 family dipeptidase [Wielerella bovis]|uniref:C69 family dipeptidase n=1 Tax=Wielerella bovis TaxID=2917790 RepID=UPI002018503C|nr:C69 family dipeptidase [Wielerella bovis]ULJ59325.1 C69 family dipeptidase [Wielerella bovis]
MNFKSSKMAFLIGTLCAISSAYACTGVYVGKQLTADGSTIFGRTEDLETHHNKTFVVFPAKHNPVGAVLKDESTGFTFTLPSQSYQYTAIPDVTPIDGVYHEAGINQFGVIVDTTVSAYANDSILKVDPLVKTGITESIMATVVLPHVKTAREGIELLARVIDEKGAGEANSLIIADQQETWYMEIVSGHQYAAVKLPDDKFVVFPNSLFMGAIDVNDTANVIASPKLIETARSAGTLVQEDGKIRVADSYAAPMKDSVKSRYWAGVNLLNPQSNITMDSEHLPFLHHTTQKIRVEDVMALQRNRFEGTNILPDDLANKKDAVIKTTHLYPIGNKNTMEAHIFQVKKDLPKNSPAIMWLAIGSPLVSPYLPFYGAIETTAEPYQVASTSYDANSYYWATSRLLDSFLANESSLKIPFQKEIEKMERPYLVQVDAESKQFAEKFKHNPNEAVQWITARTHDRSLKTFEQLKALEKQYAPQK